MSHRGLLPFLALAAGVGACTALLGDDFEIIDGQGGSIGQGGATGGATGSAGAGVGGNGNGGAGGMLPPALPIECNWALPSHIEVESLLGTGDYWSGNPDAIRLGPGLMRTYLIRGTNSPVMTGVEIKTLGPAVNETTFVSLLSPDFFGTVRVNAGTTAAVLSRATSANLTEVVMVVTSDGDTDASNATVAQLTTPLNSLPEFNYLDGVIAVPLPMGLNTVLDILIMYQTSSGEHRAAYAHYTGTPVTPTLLGGTYDNSTSELRAMVHFDGQSYAFAGGPSAMPTGTREFRLDPSAGSTTLPEVLAPVDHIVLAAGPDMTGVNFLTFTYGPPFAIFTGRVAAAAIYPADLTQFHEAAQFATFLDLPVSDGGIKWLQSIMAFIGHPDSADTQMRYWLLDAYGNERGLADLPFNATLSAGTTRTRIGDMSLAIDDLTWDTEGGKIHVAWEDEQTNPAAGGFSVMYYDQLDCQLIAR